MHLWLGLRPGPRSGGGLTTLPKSPYSTYCPGTNYEKSVPMHSTHSQPSFSTSWMCIDTLSGTNYLLLPVSAYGLVIKWSLLVFLGCQIASVSRPFMQAVSVSVCQKFLTSSYKCWQRRLNVTLTSLMSYSSLTCVIVTLYGTFHLSFLYTNLKIFTDCFLFITICPCICFFCNKQLSSFQHCYWHKH